MDTTIATSARTAACTHCHTVNRVGGGDPAQAILRSGREVARHAGVMEPARFINWCAPMLEPIVQRMQRWLRASTQPLPSTETAVVPDHPPSPGPQQKGTLLVIDVRSEREFAATAVQGAINLPLSQLEHRIRELAADQATPIALYCASGARSGVACRMLQQMGYADVRNAGGLYAAAASLQRDLRL